MYTVWIKFLLILGKRWREDRQKIIILNKNLIIKKISENKFLYTTLAQIRSDKINASSENSVMPVEIYSPRVSLMKIEWFKVWSSSV